MDWFDSANLLTQVQQYGSLGIFLLLAAGIIALPVPEETLLVLTGILVVSQKMPLFPAWIACMAGSITGISTSYLFGRTVGHFAIVRIIKRMGLSERYLDKAHAWFQRIGKWSLLVGYFIPGVRHFTGLVAGTTELPFRVFALFAYTGAIIWTNCFFWFGYHFGIDALKIGTELVTRYGVWMAAPAVIVVGVVVLFKRNLR